MVPDFDIVKYPIKSDKRNMKKANNLLGYKSMFVKFSGQVLQQF